MEHDDFYELFYSNLKNELDNENYVKSVENLINSNKFNKSNFMKLIKEEIRWIKSLKSIH